MRGLGIRGAGIPASVYVQFGRTYGYVAAEVPFPAPGVRETTEFCMLPALMRETTSEP